MTTKKEQVLIEEEQTSDLFKPYRVKVIATLLNIREGAGEMTAIISQTTKGKTYKIIEVNENWGKLDDGAGWVNLDFVKKV